MDILRADRSDPGAPQPNMSATVFQIGEQLRALFSDEHLFEDKAQFNLARKKLVEAFAPSIEASVAEGAAVKRKEQAAADEATALAKEEAQHLEAKGPVPSLLDHWRRHGMSADGQC